MSDLDIGFEQAKAAANGAGLDTDRWQMERGSKLHGISFTLVAPSWRAEAPPRRHKMGMTAREAERFLEGMVAAFGMVKP